MNELYAKCIPFDANVKGRIGGNPPQIVENSIPDGYLFYATLEHPEKENIMLSIFIHGVFRILSFTGYTENTKFDCCLSIPLKTLCIISTL